MPKDDPTPYVSGAWEVTDPSPPMPLRCWQDIRRVGPECAIVAELRKENARLRREVSRLSKLADNLPAAETHTLKEGAGYTATVSYPDGIGIVDVHCPTHGFSCSVSDLAYILLCDNFKMDQWRQEAARLREPDAMTIVEAAEKAK